MDQPVSLPNKKSLYGRDLRQDQERLYMDNDISVAFAVFDHYEVISTAQQFADILKISVEDASDRLGLLRNLNLIELVKDGYVLSNPEDGTVFLGVQGDVEQRRKTHQLKLLKMAEKIDFADKFSDKFTATCSSEELIDKLLDDILLAVSEFHEENAKLDRSEKKCLLNLALGFMYDDISEKSNRENKNV